LNATASGTVGFGDAAWFSLTRGTARGVAQGWALAHHVPDLCCNEAIFDALIAGC